MICFNKDYSLWAKFLRPGYKETARLPESSCACQLMILQGVASLARCTAKERLFASLLLEVPV
jgi:hypothetical protein